MRKQGWTGTLASAVQAQIPYALPLPHVPYVIAIEPTNHCNLRCIMCPSPALRSARGNMAMDVYDKILREAVAGGVRRIRFVGLGEPLLHPDLPRMIRAAKEGGLYTEVSTNATLLTPDVGAALLDAGLDEIGFSLDSADAAEFERIRRGARYADVIANVEAFLSLCAAAGPRAPITVARMVVLDPATVEAFSRRWSGKVDSLQFNVLRVYEATRVAVDVRRLTRKVPPSEALRRPARCRQIRSYMLINWDGRVGLCNQSGVIVGDVKTTSLAAIWRGRTMEKVRDLHARHEGMKVRVCRSCPVMEPAAPRDEHRQEEAHVTDRQEWRDDLIGA